MPWKKKRRNPLEFHKASAAETSGTHKVHRNPPELHEVSATEPSRISRGICTRTLRNLVRNLVLKLHRIAPELIWAKDPIAKFCCWGIRKLCKPDDLLLQHCKKMQQMNKVCPSPSPAKPAYLRSCEALSVSKHLRPKSHQ